MHMNIHTTNSHKTTARRSRKITAETTRQKSQHENLKTHVNNHRERFGVTLIGGEVRRGAPTEAGGVTAAAVARLCDAIDVDGLRGEEQLETAKTVIPNQQKQI